jgi:HAD superfamily hydrolase (TIGR01450 family)
MAKTERNTMMPDRTEGNARSLSDVRGFAFDLDGTIWEGPRLLPGAAELVDDLRASGIGVVFASNCSRHGSKRLADLLGEMGVAAAAAEVLTPFDLVGEVVRRKLGPARVLVIGTDELAHVLRGSGHTAVPTERWDEARAVVVGVDPEFSYDRLRAAARATSAGALLFAVNLDARFPVGPNVFDPGCGALAEAIAVAGGARPIPVGKPERSLFQAAIDRLGCAPAQAAMVGDSTASDIAGGRAAGMFTIWVDTDRAAPKPDCADLKVNDLAELHRLWKSGGSPRK